MARPDLLGAATYYVLVITLFLSPTEILVIHGIEAQLTREIFPSESDLLYL